MDVEAGDLQDWEVLHNSDSDSIEDMKDLEGVDSEGIIRPDYFSVDSQSMYSKTIHGGDVVKEGSVDSDSRNNPTSIDPASVTPSPRKEFGKFELRSEVGFVETTEGQVGSDGVEETVKLELGLDGIAADDRKYAEFEYGNELVIVENAKGQVDSDGIKEMELGIAGTVKTEVVIDEIGAESQNFGKFWSDPIGTERFDEKIEMGVGENANLRDGLEFSDEKEEVDLGLEGGDKKYEHGGMKSGGEGEKRIMVWWKLPLELLKYCVFKMSPVWTVSMAAAVMGFVILGRRYYRMKTKSRSMQLKVTLDDKKVSQFMSRAARLNEAFSIVKRVPNVRPSLPAAGVTPWPMMTLR